jgi:thiamine pyrophosphokinase
MRAVIFVNGTITDYVTLARWLHADDFLIGADGGIAHCLALGRRPAVIVGDLDSADPQEVARLATMGVQIERHPPAKNETDLELALECAQRHGADEVLLLGALGSRLDQTLGNLLILAQREWPFVLLIGEGDQLAQVMRGGEVLQVRAPLGGTVSAIPLSATVTGITYTGLEYPLIDATLHLGSTRGMSNVVAALPATIQISQGLLLVVQTVTNH